MAVTLQWLDDLDAVGAEAAGALDRARQPCLFDRIDWFRMTAAHRLAGPPLVMRARDGEDAAWLFLARAGRRRATPLASWYTLAFAPVLSRPDARALLPTLFREVRRRFGRLALHPVRDGDLEALHDALSHAGWTSFVRRATGNRTGAIAGDFASWLATRPSTLRNTMARKARSHPVRIEIHERFDAAAWKDYVAVYEASWKPAEGSLPFLRELAVREAEAGTLRLGIARDAKARAVATQLWLVERGTATIHKLAHREDARAGSPGTLLSAAMFEHVIDRDRVSRIDFGLGDEPYKADWLDDVAPVWRVDAYDPISATGLAGIARERLARLVRARGLD